MPTSSIYSGTAAEETLNKQSENTRRLLEVKNKQISKMHAHACDAGGEDDYFGELGRINRSGGGEV